MKKKILLGIGLLLAIVLIYQFAFNNSSKNITTLTSKVKKGDFKSEIVISGELQSTSSIKIKIPSGLRQLRIYQIKVQHLIPEGTLVKKGDFIAKLDPSSLNEKLLDARNDLTKENSTYIQQQIDTTLTLKKERNAIKDLRFSVEEKELELKQSKFESPTTIRQLEITLQKLKRNLQQKEEDYHIIKQKQQQIMIRVTANLSKIKNRLKNTEELLSKLTIISEGDGMLTYVKSYRGTIKTGSEINTYDPAVAVLPDLTKMESKTFANEVDVRKIKKGLKVEIGFDAFPEMKIGGVVTSVANIGEKKQGSDIKLFKVLIKLDETNKDILPGMTSSNKILTFKKENVLTTPLESIFSKDSTVYVYKKTGISIVKKEVKLGESNDDVVIIEKGINENDVVYLYKPQGYEKEAIIPLEE
ncbi:efflux RND transporter periplasmic adaptor subunit [Flavicella sediminum]|uniref:efflux RND transporter periplasmic adaptor subunit n=1 Tax=Flavicella sediminum TaxID=2585141 RepID=UPI00112085F8|nr:HlyD family secretion protein [Flavicella sediminum]